MIGSLIATGILKALAWALGEVPRTFPPYPEEQIYEIEGNISRRDGNWHEHACDEIENLNLSAGERGTLVALAVHSTELLAYYGSFLHANPMVLPKPRSHDEWKQLVAH